MPSVLANPKNYVARNKRIMEQNNPESGNKKKSAKASTAWSNSHDASITNWAIDKAQEIIKEH